MENKDTNELIELILRCKTNDDDAFSVLVGLYTPMINSTVSSLSLSVSEYFSEACIALYKAVMSYDLSQNEVTFGLYASICVKHRLLDVIRKMDRQGNIDSDFDVDSIAVSGGIVSRLLRMEESESVRAQARELLSDYEYSVFGLWLGGNAASFIAKELATDVKSVENAKARIIKKLRQGIKR